MIRGLGPEYMCIKALGVATKVTCSHVTNCRTNSHGSGRPVTGPIATAFSACLFSHAIANAILPDRPVPTLSENISINQSMALSASCAGHTGHSPMQQYTR